MAVVLRLRISALGELLWVTSSSFSSVLGAEDRVRVCDHPFHFFLLFISFFKVS